MGLISRVSSRTYRIKTLFTQQPKIDQLSGNDKIAYENLDNDAEIVINKFKTFVDKIADPLKDAIGQAKNRPPNCVYDENQLEEIYKKVISQLDALEKNVQEKF